MQRALISRMYTHKEKSKALSKRYINPIDLQEAQDARPTLVRCSVSGRLMMPARFSVRRSYLVPTYGDREELWTPIEQCARNIATPVWNNIVVRESVATPIPLHLMHNPRVVVGGRVLVVVRRVTTIGELRSVKKRAAVEGGSETRDDGVARSVGAGRERAGGAGEDVSGAGPVESAGFAKAKDVVGHAAGEVAGSRLRIDGQVGAGKAGPDLIHVVVPIVAPSIAIADQEVIGRERAERCSVVGVDELVPRTSVSLCLCAKLVDYGLEAVRGHARYRLRPPGRVSEREPHWYVDEVNIGNIGKQLIGIEGELSKRPGNVEIGVARVRDGGLDDGGAGIDFERQTRTDGKPDAAAR